MKKEINKQKVVGLNEISFLSYIEINDKQIYKNDRH